MKYLLLPLIVLAALVSACGDRRPVAVNAADHRIVWTGRTVVTPDSSVRFNFPGVAARVRFEGPSLTMATSPGSGYFMVEVDSAAPRKVFFGPGDSVMVIADSLGAGVHDALVAYAVEGYEFKPVVRSFTAGGFGQAERPKGPKIEFIGNSITCGYGTEAQSGDIRFSYETENHTLSYAWLTARVLDAEANVVSRSGIGIYRNFNGPIEGDTVGTMPLEYDRALIYEPEPMWDFARFRPDIVCINLGTNDSSTRNYDISRFESACASFVDHVREKNPSAKIVLLTGAMMRDKELADISGVLDRVAAGRPEVYRFDMTPQDGTLGYGADYHPSALQARKMAQELTAYLRTII